MNKRQLIDQRIVLLHKIDDIDKQLEELAQQNEDDQLRLKYYKEKLEKDNPVPDEFKEDSRVINETPKETI